MGIKKADCQKIEKLITAPLSCSFSRLRRLSNGYLAIEKQGVCFNKPFDKILLLPSHLEREIVSPHPTQTQPCRSAPI